MTLKTKESQDLGESTRQSTDRAELRWVQDLAVDWGRVVMTRVGEVVCHERMPVRGLQVVLDGRLHALQAAGDGLKFRRRLEVGEVIGAGLGGNSEGVYPETVETVEPAVLARFSREQLAVLKAENGAAYARLVGLVGTAEEAEGEGLRRESDLLGERWVPNSALYGIQSLRAYENFPISGIPLHFYPGFIKALAMVKLACARANHDLGLLGDREFGAIVKACQALMRGRHHSHFVVDMLQGGAGTSTNMMANEVIANLANESIGAARGDMTAVHPNNHVNLSQSTNDVYPTAFRISARIALRRLQSALVDLVDAFAERGNQFAEYIKMGRTQLQDAVPMTLGQEFHAFAANLREELERLQEAERLLEEINMGATAIGTGVNAPAGFGERVSEQLETITRLRVRVAPNLIEATQDTGAYVQLSSSLKRTAIKLSKICNDLRLLSSGPRAGLGEIRLPEAQPGSSIMPGKVNPVIPEVVNQIAYEVVGNDVTISMAAEAGQLQLNAMEPVIFWSLFKSIHHLRQGIITLTHRCVSGIEANPAAALAQVEASVGLITALAPRLGYARTSALARKALKSGMSAHAVLAEEGLLDLPEIAALLDPRSYPIPTSPSA